MAIRRRRAEVQRLENTETCPGRDAGIDRNEQGTRRAGVSLCGTDDRLRVHAGSRNGQRPSHQLLPVCRAYFARSRYWPERGRTRPFAPGLINSGTCTVTPFDSFAGFVLAVFVAVFITGDVSPTLSSITDGSSIAIGRPSRHSTCTTISGWSHGVSSPTARSSRVYCSYVC